MWSLTGWRKKNIICGLNKSEYKYIYMYLFSICPIIHSLEFCIAVFVLQSFTFVSKRSIWSSWNNWNRTRASIKRRLVLFMVSLINVRSFPASHTPPLAPAVHLLPPISRGARRFLRRLIWREWSHWGFLRRPGPTRWRRTALRIIGIWAAGNWNVLISHLCFWCLFKHQKC